MINFEKLNIFKIEKEMKNESKREKEAVEERPFTFKITKRRSPWTQEEDEAITALVNKYGTGNWTLIANEMAGNHGFKHRSGKQCRERWHNHLDPGINKDYWTELEEDILFKKHMEYGNKWSDIARFLPGRTDNAIKNHFYSKLRKFIRKILKQINKDNLLKTNSIDPNKYNSDKVYKMIKKTRIPYNSLNKESILTMILSYERSSKGGRADNLLGKKTQRKKAVKANTKENLYSEKVKQRGLKEEKEKAKVKAKEKENSNNKNVNKKGVITASISKNSTANSNSHTNPIVEMVGKVVMNGHNGGHNTNARSRRNVKKRHMKDDFIYGDEDFEEEISKIAKGRCKRKNMISRENRAGIASKNVVHAYADDSDSHSGTVSYSYSSQQSKSENSVKSNKQEHSFNDNEEGLENVNPINSGVEINNNNNNNKAKLKSGSKVGLGLAIQIPQQIQPNTPLLTPGNPDCDRMYKFESFPYMEGGIPLISPINPSKLIPPSTRNHFNIDLLHEGNFYSGGFSHFNNFLCRNNSAGTNNVGGSFLSTPTNADMKINFGNFTPSNHHTPNKEVTLHNKIVINNNEVEKVERTLTPSFKPLNEEEKVNITEINLIKEETEKKKPKRPSIDLNLVNDSETGKIFYASMAVGENVTKQSSNENAQAHEDEGTVSNISQNSNYNGNNYSVNTSQAPSLPILNKFSLLANTPSNLTISPKSAFVKINK